MLTSILSHIKDEIQPDFFVWTGDNSKSDTWSNSLEDVINYTVNISATIQSLGLDK